MVARMTLVGGVVGDAHDGLPAALCGIEPMRPDTGARISV
jgi:hypothetical protein